MKSDTLEALGGELESLPTRERGLKLQKNRHVIHLLTRSLPTRERGLKYPCNRKIDEGPQSLPTRERGLKLTNFQIFHRAELVAPYTGAWIEIF